MKLALQIIGGIAILCSTVVLGVIAYTHFLISVFP